MITTPEQRVYVTPDKKVNFPIPNTPTLPVAPPIPGPASQPRGRDPQYISSPQSLLFHLNLLSRQHPYRLHRTVQLCLLPALLLLLPLLLPHRLGLLLRHHCQLIAFLRQIWPQRQMTMNLLPYVMMIQMMKMVLQILVVQLLHSPSRTRLLERPLSHQLMR